MPLDLETLWDYSDPAASEARFRASLPTAAGDDRLVLLTQMARTHSLRQEFAAAHALLDEIEPQLAATGPRPRIYYLLERGRTFNSSRERDTARPFFLEAWTLAQTTGHVGLAVDAAHMVAITYSGTPEALAWNERGLALARPAADAKAQALLPALLNNSAWDLHEMGRYTEALALFEEARAVRVARGQAAQTQVATWAVARCLRSLGRYAEALTLQYTLEAAHHAAGTTDGYVFEEIGENLVALGQAAIAQPYFAQAYHALSQDPWFVAHEADRLAQLKAHASLASAAQQASSIIRSLSVLLSPSGRTPMLEERTNEAFELDEQLTVVGAKLTPGMQAPGFVLDALLGGLIKQVGLADAAGQVRLLNVVNSVDTPVCHKETQHWEQLRATLPDDVVVYTISADLPFALARWAASENVQHLLLSTYRTPSFGTDYGVFIKEWSLLQRAVFVIDRQGKVVHAEYVRDQMTEPNYNAAVASAAQAAA